MRISIPALSTLLVGLVLLGATDSSLARGYLWMFGYDWSGNPTPIYRYNISTGVIDRVVDTGIQDQRVNNLATDSCTLYLGGMFRNWKC